ncbi:acyltransferase family protein [Natronoglycomyces albus]|uniref:Acyltransferase n=1 Tax=Natronoglycomyces albus TaxID=2811108 RepID=A0A895XXI1_9ACTN|nr:acyltransferase family protein [Natronoglycomyces albus]QSB06338.1 acyltransferase [Natronoglycomyces albus]
MGPTAEHRQVPIPDTVEARSTTVSEFDAAHVQQSHTASKRKTSIKADPSPPKKKQSGQSPPMHFRSDIEGLRAVAVGLVVLAHINVPYFAGGYVGVDVFFVISGFLITSLLLREIARNGRISLAKFYARRALRLLPAAVTVLVATVVAAWLWLPRTRLFDVAADATAAALNVINVRLAVEGTDYMNADEPPSPLQHYWSLAVEEQFYLVWPLILILLVWLASRWKAINVTKAVVVVLSLTVVWSLMVSIERSADSPIWSYFGIHTRAWELAIGALLAVAAAKLTVIPDRLAALASWVGLGMIVLAAVLYTEQTTFPGYAALLPVLGTALVIGAGCRQHASGADALLRHRPFQFTGKISYGLYLWHWPIIMIGPSALGVEPSLAVMVPLMVLAFVLSVLTYYLIENPVRRKKFFTLRTSRGLALGGGLMTTAMAVSALVMLQPAPEYGFGEGQEVTTGKATVFELLPDSAGTEVVPDNLSPALEDARQDRPAMYEAGCLIPREEVEVAQDCWFGDAEGDHTMVLLGDSHAAQWFPPLNQLAEASGWQLFVMTKTACSVPDIAENNATLDREYTECAQWRENAFAQIEDLSPQMVVAATGDQKEVIGDDPDTTWVEGWRDTTERLLDSAEEVVTLADTPWHSTHVPDCLSDSRDNAPECVEKIDDVIPFPERREDSIEAIENAGARVIDPIPWICDEQSGKCPVVVGDLLAYRDSNHLTTTFASALTPYLAAQLPLHSFGEDA